MTKTSKFVMALSIAGVIRAARSGWRSGARRLVEIYDAIDPFGTPIHISEETTRQWNDLPARDLGQIVKQPPIIQLDSGYRHQDGALPHGDMTALMALVRDWNPVAAVEIGTFFGTTTRALALNAPEATIHTVDLPLDYQPGQEDADALPKDDHHLITGRRVGAGYTSTPEAARIVQHLVDSAKWDFAPVRGASFFFIDGAHTYEYVKNDTEKCLAVAAPRSRLVWHDADTYHADIIRYLHELFRRGHPVFRINGTSMAVLDLDR